MTNLNAKLKIAMLVCASALVLATGAQAYDLRIGNGSTTVTINPSNDRGSATNYGRNQSQVSDQRYGSANGTR
jgi:hypothetical protein